MSEKRDPDVFDSFETFSAGVAAIGVVTMAVAYWGVQYLLSDNSDLQIFLQSLLVNLIASLTVFVVAYFLLYRRIQKLRAKKDMEDLALSTAQEVETTLRKALSDYRDVFPAGRLPWLFSGKQVVDVEKTMGAGEVWVISPHLKNDTDMSDLPAQDEHYSTRETAQKNLQRKINYTFVVPDTEPIRGLLPTIRHNYEGRGGKLTIVKIAPETFGSLTMSEIAVYNPRFAGKTPRRVFFELPVSEENAWWVEPTATVSAELVERVRRIVDDPKFKEPKA